MVTSTLATRNGQRDIMLTVQVWKEGASYVAYAPELDVSSCAKTANQAKSRLREAVRSSSKKPPGWERWRKF